MQLNQQKTQQQPNKRRNLNKRIVETREALNLKGLACVCVWERERGELTIATHGRHVNPLSPTPLYTWLL